MKRKRRQCYLHTLNGLPATYEPDPYPALIIIKQRGALYPRGGGVLVGSLRTIRQQQALAIAAYPAKFRARFAAGVGHVVLELPRPR